MKITKIYVTWERRFDLGEWESQKAGAEAHAELDPDEGTLEEAKKRFIELGNLLRDDVRRRAIELLSQTKNLRVVNHEGKVISRHPFVTPDQASGKESGDAELEDFIDPA